MIERLKDLLIENNITRADLARETGIPSTTIAGWFNDKKTPSIEAAIKVASYFNVSLDFLCGNEDDIYFQNTYTKPIKKETDELTKMFSELTPYEKGQVLGFARALHEKDAKSKKA